MEKHLKKSSPSIENTGQHAEKILRELIGEIVKHNRQKSEVIKSEVGSVKFWRSHRHSEDPADAIYHKSVDAEWEDAKLDLTISHGMDVETMPCQAILRAKNEEAEVILKAYLDGLIVSDETISKLTLFVNADGEEKVLVNDRSIDLTSNSKLGLALIIRSFVAKYCDLDYVH